MTSTLTSPRPTAGELVSPFIMPPTNTGPVYQPVVMDSIVMNVRAHHHCRQVSENKYSLRIEHKVEVEVRGIHATYRCLLNHHRVSGNMFRTCTNSSWSGVEPRCVVDFLYAKHILVPSIFVFVLLMVVPYLLVDFCMRVRRSARSRIINDTRVRYKHRLQPPRNMAGWGFSDLASIRASHHTGLTHHGRDHLLKLKSPVSQIDDLQAQEALRILRRWTDKNTSAPSLTKLAMQEIQEFLQDRKRLCNS